MTSYIRPANLKFPKLWGLEIFFQETLMFKVYWENIYQEIFKIPETFRPQAICLPEHLIYSTIDMLSGTFDLFDT